LEGCKVKKDDDGHIYGILAKLRPSYFVLVSTFRSTREALIAAGTTYTTTSFDALYDCLIKEQEKILHLGLIKSTNTSNKLQLSGSPKVPKIQRNNILKRMIINQTTKVLNMTKQLILIIIK
jgi:hypothetical protein